MAFNSIQTTFYNQKSVPSSIFSFSSNTSSNAMCFQQLEADENFYKENLKHQDEILEPSDCYGLWTTRQKVHQEYQRRLYKSMTNSPDECQHYQMGLGLSCLMFI